MRIKSLLLGSAAALVAVSGARAADAIYAEPEPVEYVRVCDVYGAGFFYIPGTETCLQISGYVWYQVGAAADEFNYHGFDEGHWNKNSRARVNFDARSETEWGTLRGYIRLQAAGTNIVPSTDINAVADQAFLELGGLRMGYTESAWVTSQQAGVGQYGSHSWTGMYYGYQQRQLISYTFGAGNGLAATLSLESDDYAEGGTGDDDYMPDVVGVVTYNQAWGGVWAKAGFDEDIDGVAGFEDESGFGVQVGAQFNMPNMPGSSLRVIGYYADSDNRYGVGSPLGTSAEWSVLASYNQQFSPTLGASVGVQWFNDLYIPGTDEGSGVDAWAAEMSVVWTPVTNFEVRTELGYINVGDADVFDEDGGGADGFSGFLRFTRYF